MTHGIAPGVWLNALAENKQRIKKVSEILVKLGKKKSTRKHVHAIELTVRFGRLVIGYDFFGLLFVGSYRALVHAIGLDSKLAAEASFVIYHTKNYEYYGTQDDNGCKKLH